MARGLNISPSDRPRRVIVLTLSFGSGHIRAAAAVAEALRHQIPDADIRVVDALAGSRWLFRAAYVWPYWAMVRHAPGLWRRLFSARLRRVSRSTAPAWAFRFGCPEVFKTISAFDPDVIVAAEVAACEIADAARRSGLTAAAMVNVITDHHAEPAWVKPDVSAYVVPDESVRQQLCAWGAPDARIRTCGIPTISAFATQADLDAVRRRYAIEEGKPVVLLMGGGMGPTRMDVIARGLLSASRSMHIVAVTGHDRRVYRRLAGVRVGGPASLTVTGWTEDVAALMQAASVLVTKPGGVTVAEAQICGVPMVLFDPIPGPEEHNASRAVEAGAAILTHGKAETVSAVIGLVDDEAARARISACGRGRGMSSAAQVIARLVVDVFREATTACSAAPVLILTISNGAGHTRVAEAIRDALVEGDRNAPVMILDLADYMTFPVRMTHVTMYLWLVRHAPWLWARIDRFQKRQPHTSPEWYYRRGCRRLFDVVRRLRPAALVATEVGCCEVAALIKRDLSLTCPLVATNGEYDADRAWVQPEVDLYTVPSVEALEQLCAHGAPPRRAHVSGVPLGAEFFVSRRREHARAAVCGRLGLDEKLPLVLVAGGSEGLGRPDAVARRLRRLENIDVQIIVLAGRNPAVRRRCEALARADTAGVIRVLGWTSGMSELMHAADLLVSKPGHTFDEALATGLPLVALPPPPGSEWVQYSLVEAWGVGRAVRTLDEMAAAVEHLLTDVTELTRIRNTMAARKRTDAARHIAAWIRDSARTSARRPTMRESDDASRASVATSTVECRGEWQA
jgi:processive 1,2-diacylglycerol beta-glucosyltransferase